MRRTSVVGYGVRHRPLGQRSEVHGSSSRGFSGGSGVVARKRIGAALYVLRTGKVPGDGLNRLPL